MSVLDFNQRLDDFCQVKPLEGSAHYPLFPSNQTDSNSKIYLYGVVGSKYVNSGKLVSELNKQGQAKHIHVYLNTVGGSFAEGLAIYNTLRQHPAKITITVMGYALSMGSLIMLAADQVQCVSNGLIMIHRAHTLTWGDVPLYEKAINLLKKHDQTLTPIYAQRLGKSEAGVLDLLSAETWYTADEAKAARLIDRIVPAVAIDKQKASDGEEDMGLSSHYRNAPQAFKNDFAHCNFCY